MADYQPGLRNPGGDPSAVRPPKVRWFQFGLRTLFFVTLLVAVYLAGRLASTNRYPFAPPITGPWTAKLPAGFQRPTTVTQLPDGRYVLASGGSVFNGVYEWQNGNLVVVQPSDTRMMGLTWNWDGKQFLLVGEPPDTPTGPSYLGTTLSRPAKP